MREVSSFLKADDIIDTIMIEVSAAKLMHRQIFEGQFPANLDFTGKLSYSHVC